MPVRPQYQGVPAVLRRSRLRGRKQAFALPPCERRTRSVRQRRARGVHARPGGVAMRGSFRHRCEGFSSVGMKVSLSGDNHELYRPQAKPFLSSHVRVSGLGEIVVRVVHPRPSGPTFAFEARLADEIVASLHTERVKRLREKERRKRRPDRQKSESKLSGGLGATWRGSDHPNLA